MIYPSSSVPLWTLTDVSSFRNCWVKVFAGVAGPEMPLSLFRGKELKAKSQAEAEQNEVLELKNARDEMRNQLERASVPAVRVCEHVLAPLMIIN